MANPELEEISRRVPIKDILEHYFPNTGIKMTESNTYKLLCPFHTEKTPSFIVFRDSNSFYCFGCGEGGNIFKLVQHFEGVSFPYALAILAERAGVSISGYRKTFKEQNRKMADIFSANESAAKFFSNYLNRSSDALAYVKETRKINDEMISRFGIGFAPGSWNALIDYLRDNFSKATLLNAGLVRKKTQLSDYGDDIYDFFRNRIMFPIHNRTGKIVGFAGRALDPEDDIKYLNTGETIAFKKDSMLYGLAQALRPTSDINFRKTGDIILMEGYTDVISWFQHGIENTLATGGTALTDNQARTIAQLTRKPVVCRDSDAAGINAALKDAKKLLQYMLSPKIVLLPEKTDPDEFIRTVGSEKALSFVEKNKKDLFGFALENIMKQTDASTPDSRRKIVEQMTGIILAPRDSLLRCFYIEDLAKKIGTDPKFVYYHIFKEQKDLKPEILYTINPSQSAENELLHILMRWPDLRKTTNLALDKFSTPERAAIYSYIMSTDKIPREMGVVASNGNSQQNLFFKTESGLLLDKVVNHSKNIPINIDSLIDQLADIVFSPLQDTSIKRYDVLIKQVKEFRYSGEIADIHSKILEGKDLEASLRALLRIRQKEQE